ncbi:carboxypeptidase-like regulatory domain-containing protein [uncultured Paludibaculum sp.]|uniref:carboxypeptidase-like regulatory domain-containing protein n=1 Tax=uncultured Paludibaculum sp. TaxID=1765020 RepID=UPI002AAB3568|nr:carboxypeptidase-like regulatory domain-containing protein [uncultured Paludibaculum sp.]
MNRLFTAFFVAAMAAQTRQAPGTISGIVVDAAGVPVNQARLQLTNDETGDIGASAGTQPNGEFRFDRVAPGNYYLHVSHYRHHGPLGGPQTGVQVEVKSGRETAGVRLAFAPPAVVSGRILNDDAEPVEGCQVFLLPAGPREGAGNRLNMALTSDRGVFRFDSVPPDRYVAFARCLNILPTEHLLDVVSRDGFETRSTWLPVFYPDSPTRAGAQPFAAAPGLDPDLEFHLQPTPVSTLTGRLTATPGVAWQEPINIELHRPGSQADRDDTGFSGTFDEKAGSFSIRAVPPGSYQLLAMTKDRNSTTPGYANFPVTVGDTAPDPFPIVLRPGTTVAGVVEDGPGTRSIHSRYIDLTENSPTGSVTRKEKQPPGKIVLESVDAGDTLVVPPADIDSEIGRFSFPSVPAGRWRVRYQTYDASSYAEGLQLNERLAEDGIIEVPAEPTPPLRLRLAPRPQVDFDLQPTSAGQEVKWIVLALPERPSLTVLGDMVAIGKPGSLAVLDPLPPGRYRLLALELGFAVSQDRAPLLPILTREIEPVEVTATGKQTLPVRCFTRAQVEKVIKTYLYGDDPPPAAP